MVVLRGRMQWAADVRIIGSHEEGPNMVKTISLIFLLALAGCSGIPQGQYAASPCATNPGGYDCQIQNYFRAP